jgi:hypothetical protein
LHGLREQVNVSLAGKQGLVSLGQAGRTVRQDMIEDFEVHEIDAQLPELACEVRQDILARQVCRQHLDKAVMAPIEKDCKLVTEPLGDAGLQGRQRAPGDGRLS